MGWGWSELVFLILKDDISSYLFSEGYHRLEGTNHTMGGRGEVPTIENIWLVFYKVVARYKVYGGD